MWTQLAPCLIDGHHAAAIVKGVTSASAVPAAAFVVKTGVRDDYHRYRSRSRGRHVSSIRPPEQRVQRTSPSGSWRAVDRQGCWENPYSQRIAMAGNAGKSSRRRRRLFNAVGNLRAGSAGVGSSVGPRDSDLDETAPVEVHRPPSIRDEMLQILRPDIPKILVSMFLAVVGTAAALVGPLNYARVVSVILDPSPSASRLLRAVAILGVGYIVEPTMTYFYVRSMSRVVDRAAARLKARAFRALLSREVAFFDLMGSAELSAAVTTDVMVVKEAIQGNLQRDRGLRAVMETILGLLVLVVLSPRLAWIFGMVIPLTAWGLAESRKKLAQLGEEEGKSLAVEAAIASEAVRNIREVRGFGAEGREVARFEAASSRVGPVSARIGEASGRLEALNRAAIYFSIATVMFTGGRLVSLGLMSAPLLLSFVGFCFSLNFAMQGVNFTITDFKRGQAALQRVYQVIAPPGVVGKAARAGMDVISPRDFEGRVDFCKVHFTYPTRPDKPVFSGLDLTLSAGKVTALVGRSGGGKSTIAALLSRFYAPSRGDILIDGMDVTELDRKWLTQKMALVGQNPALFTGTIAENIAYGVPNEVDSISMDKIVEAAELANARDFIEEFPQGFSTFIGEGGVQLSGGQRQRIAIARALLKDARILILDEATSALDAQSEALVQEALSRLMAGRTVLVIAHRLSTVVSADKICVLHQGKVIEEGKHDELLERKGSYANLMTTQVQSFSTIA